MDIFRGFQLLNLLWMLSRRMEPSGLVTKIGFLHGLPQKFGQHLTFYADFAAMGFHELYTSGQSEDIPIFDRLAGIGLVSEPETVRLVAQASLGQVYRLQRGNSALAVKAKYLRIHNRLKTDFIFLKGFIAFMRVLPVNTKALRLLVAALEESLSKECDYRLEAFTQQEAATALKQSDLPVYAPQVYKSYCNDNLIVSEWVDGVHLHEFFDRASALDRETVFRLLLALELLLLNHCNMVHADPHPGNFVVRRTSGGKIALTALDFGSVQRLGKESKPALIKLLCGEITEYAELEKLLSAFGFSDQALALYRPVMGDVVSILLEPFLTDAVFDFTLWRHEYKINTLLASREWPEPLALPGPLVLVLRMIQGLYYYAKSYHITINWQQTARKILNGGISA